MKTQLLTKTEMEELRGNLLANSGLTVPTVAKKHNVSRQFAYMALTGHYESRKANAIRAYVAERSRPRKKRGGYS